MAESPAHFPRARVLLAEDSTVIQKLMTRMLETLNCRVDVAVNGREVVEMAVTCSYELVFMDCHMPEMDGFEATAEIRRRQSHGCHTPIIALTGNTAPSDRERCLQAGMDDYLNKPMKVADIITILQRWLAPVARESL